MRFWESIFGKTSENNDNNDKFGGNEGSGKKTGKMKSPLQSRRLQMEQFEERVLLSVTAHDHDSYCAYPLPQVSGDVLAKESLLGISVGNLVAPLSQTFMLNSNPGSNFTIYLDFLGATTSNSQFWNVDKGFEPIVTPVFSFDDDASFSDAELEMIQNLWQWISEDFSAFDVNVTTQISSLDQLTYSGEGDATRGIRVLIGGDGAWLGEDAVGVGPLGSFSSASDDPCFVFSDLYLEYNSVEFFEKGVAETISHEVGHTLGLEHHGDIYGASAMEREYYLGHNDWAPIMGIADYVSLSQWSTGDYYGASNPDQSDILLMMSENGFSYRADDHGNTITGATTLNGDSNGNVSASGIIERSTDYDVFRIDLNTYGSINIEALAGTRDANLDIYLELLDSNGTVLMISDPEGTLDASLSYSGAAGTYYLRISGTGWGDPLDGGYSDYGSIGQYTITGNVTQASTPSTGGNFELRAVFVNQDTTNNLVTDLAYNIAPTSLLLRFDEGITIDEAFLKGIRIYRSGDGDFDRYAVGKNWNDYEILISCYIHDERTNEVIIQFGENLLDDLYEIHIIGANFNDAESYYTDASGNFVGIPNFVNNIYSSTSNEHYRTIVPFELNLGPQVTAVVPQPTYHDTVISLTAGNYKAGDRFTISDGHNTPVVFQIGGTNTTGVDYIVAYSANVTTQAQNIKTQLDAAIAASKLSFLHTPVISGGTVTFGGLGVFLDNSPLTTIQLELSPSTLPGLGSTFTVSDGTRTATFEFVSAVAYQECLQLREGKTEGGNYAIQAASTATELATNITTSINRARGELLTALDAVGSTGTVVSIRGYDISASSLSGMTARTVVTGTGVTVKDGALNQERNVIEVYFSDDELMTLPADKKVDQTPGSPPELDPRFFTLFITQDTLETGDDLYCIPTKVTYEYGVVIGGQTVNRALLYFETVDVYDGDGTQTSPQTGIQSITDLSELGTGSFRLRIGNEYHPTETLHLDFMTLDAGDAFYTAIDINNYTGTNGEYGEESSNNYFNTGAIGPQSLIIHGQILATVDPIENAGSREDPGHRDLAYNQGIDVENHLSGEVYLAQDTHSGPTVIYYNFNQNIGNGYKNEITEAQKNLARTIFEMYSRYLGIIFVESDNSGITVGTGDLATFGGAYVSGTTAVDGIGATLFDQDTGSLFSLALMDKNRDWGENVYGGSWFETAIHEIGHCLGFGHTYDVDGSVMGGDAGQDTWPGLADILHGLYMYRTDSNDIDVYKFAVDNPNGGTFSAEIYAERQNYASNLNAVLTLYKEVETVIELIMSDGSIIQHTQISYEVIARNDDYFSNDSFFETYLPQGNYFICVSSTGNDEYNPNMESTGEGGLTDGKYSLRLNFTPNGVNPNDTKANEYKTFKDETGTEFLVDSTGIKLDGDYDATPGNVYDYWFTVQQSNDMGMQWNNYMNMLDDLFAAELSLLETERNGTTVGSDDRQIVDMKIARLNTDWDESLKQLETSWEGLKSPLRSNFAATPLGDKLYDAAMDQYEINMGIYREALSILNRTIFVDNSSRTYTGKSADVIDANLNRRVSEVGEGTLSNPFVTIHHALYYAEILQKLFETSGFENSGLVVRIVGNNMNDDDYDDPTTLTNNKAYEVGTNSQSNRVLTDGASFDVPKGVSLMIDAGVAIKFAGTNLTVGSTSQYLDHSGGSVQVLGTPVRTVLLTSYYDETIGVDTYTNNTAGQRGDWGGIVIRNDVDNNYIENYDPASGKSQRVNLESQGIFLNYINHGVLLYGGSSVASMNDGVTYNPIHMVEARPTVTFNTIMYAADAAVSADPASFEETRFQTWDHNHGDSSTHAFTTDYTRVGPSIYGNYLSQNTQNGLLVKVQTGTEAIKKFDVSARFDDYDIVHIISENIIIEGTPGGNIRDLNTAPSLGNLQLGRPSISFTDTPITSFTDLVINVTAYQFGGSYYYNVNFDLEYLQIQGDMFGVHRNAQYFFNLFFDKTDLAKHIESFTVNGTVVTDPNFSAYAGLFEYIEQAFLMQLSYDSDSPLYGLPVYNSDPVELGSLDAVLDQTVINLDSMFGTRSAERTMDDERGITMMSSAFWMVPVYAADEEHGARPTDITTLLGPNWIISVNYELGASGSLNPEGTYAADDRYREDGFTISSLPSSGEYFTISDGMTSFTFEYCQFYFDNGAFYGRNDVKAGNIAINIYVNPNTGNVYSYEIGTDGAWIIDIDNPITDVPAYVAQLTASVINDINNRAEIKPQTSQSYKILAHVDSGSNHVFLSSTGSELVTYGLGATKSRTDGSLVIDPGIILKVNSARFEIEMGAQLLAEGTADQPIIITSFHDRRYGASGSFDTIYIESGILYSPNPGDWSGINVMPNGFLSIDNARISYAGGVSRIEGTTDRFNTIEIHEADARITNSRFEYNTGGSAGSRLGRGDTTPSVIYVHGSQPIIVNNEFLGNKAGSANSTGALAVISVSANSMTAENVVDPGRSTGAVNQFTQYSDNYGPMIRDNTMSDNSLNGMVVRGNLLVTESVWDDADIVHVLYNEIVISNYHHVGGLRLLSQSGNSLVIKLLGNNAGFTTMGEERDYDDRIGGSLQIVGVPGYPVILTSLKDDTVGAGFTIKGDVSYDTNNDKTSSYAIAGDWRSVKFDDLSNDRNVQVIREFEKTSDPSDLNSTRATSQYLGVLAKEDKAGDDTLRLGFEVHGSIRNTDASDIDVYQFQAFGGTEMWIDLDFTDRYFDSIIEIVDANGNVIARSDNSFYESLDEYGNYIDTVYDSNAQTASRGTTTGFTSNNNAFPLQDSYWDRQGNYGSNDLYTTNVRDSGLRFVTTGSSSTLATYYVRIRSAVGMDGVNMAQLTDGTMGYRTAAELHDTTFSIYNSLTNQEIIFRFDNTVSTSRVIRSTSSDEKPNTIVIGIAGVGTTSDTIADRIVAAINRYASSANSNLSVSARIARTSLTDTNPSIILDGVSLVFDPGNTGISLHANSSGNYIMQIRLQDTDEVPGCSVYYAEMRYATTAIEVIGFPQHSSTQGEFTEAGGNNSFGTAQTLGNLAAYDKSTISVSGHLDNLQQVDWYEFTLNVPGVQNYNGYSPESDIWSAIFDIDYADGRARPDLSMYVYNQWGQLLYIGTDSNISDDRSERQYNEDSSVSSIEKLTAGSSAAGDPYIGTAILKTEAIYYVAVTSKWNIPSVINDVQNFNTNDTLFSFNGISTAFSANTRIQPLNTAIRVVEERVESGQYIDDNGQYNEIEAAQRLVLTADEYHLGDVVAYTSTRSSIYLINPSTGYTESTNGIGTGTAIANDVALRFDGRLVTTYTSGNTTYYREINQAASGTSISTIDTQLYYWYVVNNAWARLPGVNFTTNAMATTNYGMTYSSSHQQAYTVVIGNNPGTNKGSYTEQEGYNKLRDTNVMYILGPDGNAVNWGCPDSTRTSPQEGTESRYYNSIVPHAVFTTEQGLKEEDEIITGAVFGYDNELYVATDKGNIYRVTDHKSYGFYKVSPSTAPLTWYVDAYALNTGPQLEYLGTLYNDNGAVLEFAGLTKGPANVEGGIYAGDMLFGLVATSVNGGAAYGNTVAAFTIATLNTQQNNIENNGIDYTTPVSITRPSMLEPIFANGARSITVAQGNGLAFSPIDYNLWHRTSANSDPNFPTEDDVRYIGTGGTSWYFGLENHNNGNHSIVDTQPGAISYESRYGAGDANSLNTYNVPGGAYGSLTSNDFSLKGYAAEDLPTIYFSYKLGAGSSDQPIVYVSSDEAPWTAIAIRWDYPAANATTISGQNYSTGLSGYHNSSIGLDGNYMINDDVWRQARVDLAAFAGHSGVKLRFVFSTGGGAIGLGTSTNTQSTGTYISAVPAAAIIDNRSNSNNAYLDTNNRVTMLPDGSIGTTDSQFYIGNQLYKFSQGYSMFVPVSPGANGRTTGNEVITITGLNNVSINATLLEILEQGIGKTGAELMNHYRRLNSEEMMVLIIDWVNSNSDTTGVTAHRYTERGGDVSEYAAWEGENPNVGQRLYFENAYNVSFATTTLSQPTTGFVVMGAAQDNTLGELAAMTLAEFYTWLTERRNGGDYIPVPIRGDMTAQEVAASMTFMVNLINNDDMYAQLGRIVANVEQTIIKRTAEPILRGMLSNMATVQNILADSSAVDNLFSVNKTAIQGVVNDIFQNTIQQLVRDVLMDKDDARDIMDGDYSAVPGIFMTNTPLANIALQIFQSESRTLFRTMLSDPVQLRNILENENAVSEVFGLDKAGVQTVARNLVKTELERVYGFEITDWTDVNYDAIDWNLVVQAINNWSWAAVTWDVVYDSVDWDVFDWETAYDNFVWTTVTAPTWNTVYNDFDWSTSEWTTAIYDNIDWDAVNWTVVNNAVDQTQINWAAINWVAEDPYSVGGYLDQYFYFGGQLQALLGDGRELPGAYDNMPSPYGLVNCLEVATQRLELTLRMDNSSVTQIVTGRYGTERPEMQNAYSMTLITKSISITSTTNGISKAGPLIVYNSEMDTANSSTFFDSNATGTTRALDNQHSGFYIDNIIIGAAERGEIVINAPTTQWMSSSSFVRDNYASYYFESIDAFDNFVNVIHLGDRTAAYNAYRNDYFTAATDVRRIGSGGAYSWTQNWGYPSYAARSGDYQLEIRRGTESYTYDEESNWTNWYARYSGSGIRNYFYGGYTTITSLMHTNERLTDGITIVVPDITDLYHGQRFSLSDGVSSVEFVFLHSSLGTIGAGNAQAIYFNELMSRTDLWSAMTQAINRQYNAGTTTIQSSNFTSSEFIDLFRAVDFKNGGLDPDLKSGESNSYEAASRNGEGGKPIKHIFYGTSYYTPVFEQTDGATTLYEGDQNDIGSDIRKFLSDTNVSTSRLFIDRETVTGDRRGDENLVREKGQLNIYGVKITDAANYGISITPRTSNQPGAMNQMDNNDMVTGVSIVNNIIAFCGSGGIYIEGSPNAYLFARIVNNTIYGAVDGRQGVGIHVGNYAAPTIMNNAIANLTTGVNVTWRGSNDYYSVKFLNNLYQNSDAYATVLSREGLSSIVLGPNDPLFLDPANYNFYPDANSLLIDGSSSSLLERSTWWSTYLEQLGIPMSSILAPSTDIYGQVREAVLPGGLGANTNIDIGAVDRSDFTSPSAKLIHPWDRSNTNDPSQTPNDYDTTMDSVLLLEETVGYFRILLSDGSSGMGIDEISLNEDLTLKEYVVNIIKKTWDYETNAYKHEVLKLNHDYFANYNGTTGYLTITPQKGEWDANATYSIILDNDTKQYWDCLVPDFRRDDDDDPANASLKTISEVFTGVEPLVFWIDGQKVEIDITVDNPDYVINGEEPAKIIDPDLTRESLVNLIVETVNRRNQHALKFGSFYITAVPIVDGNGTTIGVRFDQAYDVACGNFLIEVNSYGEMSGGKYVIDSVRDGIRDLAYNPLLPNQSNGQTRFTIVFASYDYADAPQNITVDTITYNFPTVWKADGTGGPRHVLYDGFSLGTRISPESDGRPSLHPTVDGEQVHGDTFDDGVKIVELVPGQNAIIEITVNATNPAFASNVDDEGYVGYVVFWLDFDGNGVWNDTVYSELEWNETTGMFESTGPINTTGEKFIVKVKDGVNKISLPIPDLQVDIGGGEYATRVGDTYARFRLISNAEAIRIGGVGNLRQTGEAKDGEVEDYKFVMTNFARGYGDAPNKSHLNPNTNLYYSYPVLASENGAWHAIGGEAAYGLNGDQSLYFGSLSPVSMLDGAPSRNADRNTTDDGFRATNATGSGSTSISDLVFVRGAYTSITVTVTIPAEFVDINGSDYALNTSIYASGWFDWNCDGDWADSGEYSNLFTMTAGTFLNANRMVEVYDSSSNLIGYRIEHDVNILVPGTAADPEGVTFARFRLSSDNSIANANGYMSDHDADPIDGEVEDYMIYVGPQQYDRGDAPASYGTVSHALTNEGIYLGTGVTAERVQLVYPQKDDDGEGSAANRQDVAFPWNDTNTKMIVYENGSTEFTVYANEDGKLSIWIDLNGNGVFDGNSERIYAANGDAFFTVTAGENTLSLDLPSLNMIGSKDTWARFRFTDNSVDHTLLGPTDATSQLTVGGEYGAAAVNGEVIDHQLTLFSRSLTISGNVFSDLNANGQYDAVDRGTVPRVTLENYNAGTSLIFDANGMSQVYQLGFAFSLGGDTYTSFQVSNTGAVVLGKGAYNTEFAYASSSNASFDISRFPAFYPFFRTDGVAVTTSPTKLFSGTDYIQINWGNQFVLHIANSDSGDFVSFMYLNMNTAAPQMAQGQGVYVGVGLGNGTSNIIDIGNGPNSPTMLRSTGSSVQFQSQYEAFLAYAANSANDSIGYRFSSQSGLLRAEQGVAGERVFIDINQNGVWDADEPITTTLSDGSFSFNVYPGTYTIVHMRESEFAKNGLPTIPGTHYDSSGYYYYPNVQVLEGGSSVSDIDFGYFSAGSIGIGNTTVVEGEGYAEIDLILNDSFGAAINVIFETIDGTALATSDYTYTYNYVTIGGDSIPRGGWYTDVLTSVSSASGLYDNSLSRDTLAFTRKDGNGTWQVCIQNPNFNNGVPVAITNSTYESVAPQVLETEDGMVHVVWLYYNGLTYDLMYSSAAVDNISSLGTAGNVFKLNQTPAATVGLPATHIDCQNPQISTDGTSIFTAWTSVNQSTKLGDVYFMEVNSYNLQNKVAPTVVSRAATSGVLRNISNANLSSLVMDGRNVVWSSDELGVQKVYLYSHNSSQPTAAKVISGSGENATPVIYGDLVAWSYRPSGDHTKSDIAIYNITANNNDGTSGKRIYLTGQTLDYRAPVLSEDWLVWEVNNGSGISNFDILSYRLSTIDWASMETNAKVINYDITSSDITPGKQYGNSWNTYATYSDPVLGISSSDSITAPTLNPITTVVVSSVNDLNNAPFTSQELLDIEIVVNNASILTDVLAHANAYKIRRITINNGVPASLGNLTWDMNNVESLVINGNLSANLTLSAPNLSFFQSSGIINGQTTITAELLETAIFTSGIAAPLNITGGPNMHCLFGGPITASTTVNNVETLVFHGEVSANVSVTVSYSANIHTVTFNGPVSSPANMDNYRITIQGGELHGLYFNAAAKTDILATALCSDVSFNGEASGTHTFDGYWYGAAGTGPAIHYNDAITGRLYSSGTGIERMFFNDTVSAPIEITGSLRELVFNGDITTSVSTNTDTLQSVYFNGNIDAREYLSPLLEPPSVSLRILGANISTLVINGAAVTPIRTNSTNLKEIYVNGLVTDSTVFTNTSLETVYSNMAQYGNLLNLLRNAGLAALPIVIADSTFNNVTRVNSGDDLAAAVYGNNLVWLALDQSTGRWNVHYADLSVDSYIPVVISEQSSNDWYPKISETGRIIWRNDTQDKSSIYQASLSPAQTTVTIRVPIRNDYTAENDEYFFVRIVSASFVDLPNIPQDLIDQLQEQLIDKLRNIGVVWILNDDGNMSMGTAPETYRTSTANIGPRHLTSAANNATLGTLSNKSDGITFLSPLVPGQMATIEVTVTQACYLNAFFDWNGNGSFGAVDLASTLLKPAVTGTEPYLAFIDVDGEIVPYTGEYKIDPLTGNVTGASNQLLYTMALDMGSLAELGEQVFGEIGYQLTAGSNIVSFMVPENAKTGETWSRFRISAQGGLSFFGYANNGDVEDYKVTVQQPNSSVSYDEDTKIITINGSVLNDNVTVFFSNPDRNNMVTVKLNDLTMRTFALTEVAGIQFVGGGGVDSVTVYGTIDAETAHLDGSDSRISTLAGNGFTMNIDGASKISFHGRGGEDVVTVLDTAFNDTATLEIKQGELAGVTDSLYRAYGNITGGGVEYNINDVYRLNVSHISGGTDSAWLSSANTVTNVVYDANSGTLRMIHADSAISVTDFQRLNVTGNGSGAVRLENLGGSPGNELNFNFATKNASFGTSDLNLYFSDYGRYTVGAGLSSTDINVQGTANVEYLNRNGSDIKYFTGQNANDNALLLELVDLSFVNGNSLNVNSGNTGNTKDLYDSGLLDYLDNDGTWQQK